MKLIHINDLPVETVSHNPAIKKRTLLSSGELPPLNQFARAVFPPDTCAPTHVHSDMDELFFVESGSGRITINGQSLELASGSMILVHAGEEHELSSAENEELIVLYFGLLLPEGR